MKIELEELSIRNFMSFGNADQLVSLKQPGTTLIVGEDLDNVTHGKTANGVGKSSLLNALTYALYDKPISNISKDKLVNNINNKNMVVKLKFTIGVDSYVVTRMRKTKAGAGGNTVTLFKNGVDITRGANETNVDIETIIGIPHELFVRIIVFSASHVPFLDLPATSQVGANQKDFIEELFGLTTLTIKADALRERMKDTKSSMDTKRIYLRSLEGERERHLAQLNNAKQRVIAWEAVNSESISKLRLSLDSIANVDVAEQKRLHTGVGELTDKLKKAQSSLRECQVELGLITKKHQTIVAELSHLRDATCPYCKQDFVSSSEKILTCEASLLELKTKTEELTIIKATADEEVNNLDRKILDMEGLISVSNIDQLVKLSSDQASINQRIADMSEAVNPHLESLDELESLVLPDIDYTEIEELETLLIHQEFLLKLLTKKDSFIRKALLDKSIPYLNSQLKHYLISLGLPHSVTFTHEMTASISRFGTQLDFGNLSTGQRARVNLALSFAFRNVLQNLHSSVNVCMLDEVFDFGLDAAGVQLAVKLVKQKTREENLSMYIISHREEVATLFDRVMKVEFSKGFSTIVS